MKKTILSLASFFLCSTIFLLNPYASEAKPIKLAFALNVPSTSWQAQHCILPWVKQVEEATKGEVTFEIYYSGTLLKSPDVWKGLNSGVADIGSVPFFFTRGLTTLTDVISLPFLEYQSAKQQSGIAWKLFEKFPEIQNEYKANKLLLLYSSTPFFFITSEKKITKMDDFDGLKIRIPGAEAVKLIMQSVGAVPIGMRANDVYQSMEKGVIDGSICNWDLLQSYGLFEVAKYYTFGPFNSGAMGVAMNQGKWNSLSKEVQDQIMSVSGEAGSKFWGENTYDKAIIPAKEKVKSAGYEMNEYIFTPEQVQKWKRLHGEKIWNAWKQSAIAKAKAERYSEPEGLVQNLIDTTENLIKTYKP